MDAAAESTTASRTLEQAPSEIDPAAAAASDARLLVAAAGAAAAAAPAPPSDGDDGDGGGARAPETAITATATGNPASVSTLLTKWHFEEIKWPNERAITNCAARMSTFLQAVPFTPQSVPWSPALGSIWQK